MTINPQSTEDEALKALKAALDTLRLAGDRRQEVRSATIARNVLHEELGRFGPFPQRYDLADHTRDVLITHGRQDAAHAVGNTTDLLVLGRRLVRMLGVVMALNVVLLGAVAVLLLR